MIYVQVNNIHTMVKVNMRSYMAKIMVYLCACQISNYWWLSNDKPDNRDVELHNDVSGDDDGHRNTKKNTLPLFNNVNYVCK